MTTQEVFIKADEALLKVIEQLPEDKWEKEMPKDFPTFGEGIYTLRQIMNYQAYDEAWVPAMMEGKTMDELGKDKFGEPFSGKTLGENPKKSYAELVEKAAKAVNNLNTKTLEERTVHFSYGDFPAEEALRHITIFRGMRVYDFSKAFGLSTKMDRELVQGLWEIISPRAEEWRSMGVFEAEVDVPEDAPLQDRLLGLTGRKP